MFLNKHHFFFIACVTFSYHALINGSTHTSIPIQSAVTAWTISDDAKQAHVILATDDNTTLPMWRIDSNLSVPVSITPELARVNNEDDVANPFLKKTITKISSMPFNNSFVVTTREEPAVVYTLTAPSSAKAAIYSSDALIDSNKSQNTCIEHIQGTNTSTAFAVLRSLDTDSDQLYSLALFKLKEKMLENNALQFELAQVDPFFKPKTEDADAQTQQPESTQVPSDETNAENQTEEKKEEPEDIRSIAFDKSAEFLSINHPLLNNPEITCLHWNPRMRCLYIGLRVQAGEQEDAGACALVLAKLDSKNKTVPIGAINPRALPAHDDSRIVAAVGSKSTICLHHLNSLHTSTDLDYVIVVGGVGDQEKTKNTVYALPQFNPREISYYTGMVASNNQPLKFGKNPAGYHYVAIREFIRPAMSSDELVSSNDACATVGNGPLINGPISSITCVGDTVFASVSQPCAGHKGGIFSSQALFDTQGRIATWTPWTPVCAINDDVRDFKINYPEGSVMWLTQDQTGAPVIKTHSLVNAQQASNPTAKALSQLFETHGGIACMRFFNTKQPSGSADQLAVAAGKTTIAFTCSQFENNQQEISVVDASHEQAVLDSGTIAFVHNDTLDQLRTITCLEHVTTTTGNYLLVGGSKGLAVLCAADGSSLLNAETGVLDARSCSVYSGDFMSVKKIVADENNLYVLTQKALIRIDLTKSDIAHNQLESHILARAQQFQTTVINDVLIGHGRALLATGSGVYLSRSNYNCANATQNQLAWETIHLPEMVLPIIKLNAYTPTARERDLFTQGGMVHVIGSYRGKNITHVHRLILQPDESQQMQVSLLQEIYQDGNRSNFAGYQTHKELFVTDGALYLSAPSSAQNPTLECGMEKHTPVALEFKNEDKIHVVVKNNITGQWFIAGTFGLFTF